MIDGCRWMTLLTQLFLGCDETRHRAGSPARWRVQHAIPVALQAISAPRPCFFSPKTATPLIFMEIASFAKSTIVHATVCGFGHILHHCAK
jgi:hypothetical protein